MVSEHGMRVHDDRTRKRFAGRKNGHGRAGMQRHAPARTVRAQKRRDFGSGVRSLETRGRLS